MEKLFAMKAGLDLTVLRKLANVIAMIRDYAKMESAFASAASQVINANSSNVQNYAVITEFVTETESANASKASKAKNAMSLAYATEKFRMAS